MAGGFKVFGPTYNATKYVRTLHEGMVNGNHAVSAALVTANTDELAGKVASVLADGIGLCDKGVGAVGLFVEDLGDMVNASGMASFYFRGGEYAVAVERTGFAGTEAEADVIGKELTTNATGEIIVKGTTVGTNDGPAIGVCTGFGEFTMGNMFEHAGTAANGGKFVSFILYM